MVIACRQAFTPRDRRVGTVWILPCCYPPRRVEFRAAKCVFPYHRRVCDDDVFLFWHCCHPALVHVCGFQVAAVSSHGRTNIARRIVIRTLGTVGYFLTLSLSILLVRFRLHLSPKSAVIWSLRKPLVYLCFDSKSASQQRRLRSTSQYSPLFSASQRLLDPSDLRSQNTHIAWYDYIAGPVSSHAQSVIICTSCLPYISHITFTSPSLLLPFNPPRHMLSTPRRVLSSTKINIPASPPQSEQYNKYGWQVPSLSDGMSDQETPSPVTSPAGAIRCFCGRTVDSAEGGIYCSVGKSRVILFPLPRRKVMTSLPHCPYFSPLGSDMKHFYSHTLGPCSPCSLRAIGCVLVIMLQTVKPLPHHLDVPATCPHPAYSFWRKFVRAIIPWSLCCVDGLGLNIHISRRLR